MWPVFLNFLFRRANMNDNENPLSGGDESDRRPYESSSNGIAAQQGGLSGEISNVQAHQSPSINQTGVASAIFDDEYAAQQAVSALRQAGVSDSDLSIIAQSKGTMTTREGGDEITDAEHSSYLRGILGGGALGAGLGVAALAIPGVGPLAAIGAIAATVVPEAMAIGAVAGAAAGTFNEALKDYGVSDDDAAYYGDRMKNGGVLLTANASNIDQSQAQEMLYQHGGHSSSRVRNIDV
jgi:hypothetical protein